MGEADAVHQVGDQVIVAMAEVEDVAVGQRHRTAVHGGRVGPSEVGLAVLIDDQLVEARGVRGAQRRIGGEAVEAKRVAKLVSNQRNQVGAVGRGQIAVERIDPVVRREEVDVEEHFDVGGVAIRVVPRADLERGALVDDRHAGGAVDLDRGR